MFDNIGAKIKMLAKVVCWIEIIGSIIAGIVVVANGHDLEALGVGIMLGGSLFSWVGSLFIYGFGQLIEDNQALRQKLAPEEIVPNKESTETVFKNDSVNTQSENGTDDAIKKRYGI